MLLPDEEFEVDAAPNALLNGLPPVAYAEKAEIVLLLPAPNTEVLTGDPERFAFFPRCPKPKPNPTPEWPCPDVEGEAKVGVGDLGRLAAEANGDEEDANASNPVRFCAGWACGVDRTEEVETDGEKADVVAVDADEIVEAGVDATEDEGGLEGDADGVKENGEDDGGGELSTEGDQDEAVLFACPNTAPPEDENTLGPLTLAKGELDEAYAMKPDYT